MYALTIKQPWATLIAMGLKPIENRAWLPPPSMIGQRIAIHTGLARSKEGLEMARRLSEYGAIEIEPPRPGELICTVRIAGVVHSRAKCPEAARPWWSGPHALILEDVRPIARSPRLRGLLRFWRVPDDVAAEL